MKTVKRIGSFLLALVMVLSMIPATHAHAATISGSCGDDVSWEFDSTYSRLTISGVGPMDDYEPDMIPWYGYRALVKTVVIGDYVTSVGAYAFYNTPELQTVRIGSGVKSISEGAFMTCPKLTNVNFNGTSQLATIGENAFSYCSLLYSITIPSSVREIAHFAFSHSDYLREITFQGNAPTIEGNAFSSINYNNFTRTAYYPKNDATWSEIVSQNVDEARAYYGSFLIWTPYCPHSWQDATCTVAKTCTLCGVTNGTPDPDAHSWVDANCTNAKTCAVCGTTEGEAIPTAHTWVEANCTYAKTCSTCNISEGDAISDAHVFESNVCKYCGLQGGTCGVSAYWTLEGGMLTIYGSGDMTSAPWPKENITTAIIEEGITSICESAFKDCEKLTSVTIPDTVTTLGSNCFDSCENLASVDLPEGITAIPSSAFAYCWALAGIQIPESVTSIGYKAFAYCREMAGMQIPEKVTSIGGDAFTGCSKLKFVRFNGNAPTLGNYAFRSLTLKAFYPGYDTTWTSDVRKPYGGTVTWVAYDQTHTEHSFDANGLCSCGCIGGTCGQSAQWALDPVTGALYISGTGKMEDYASSSQTPWAAYKDTVRKVVVEEGITHVGGCAFKEFSNLEEISLPDSLKSIGSEAIMLCKKLTKIEIPSGVTQIGVYAFEQCYALESVVLPNGLSTINDGLFNSCTSLKTVTIPASVTAIGRSAFNGCGQLTDVYYGSNEKAWNQVTIGSYNNPLLSATVHYTDPCLQGHNEVCGVCTNCGIGLNLQDYQYTLNESAATVTLTDYIGNGTDVHVAATYLLSGKEYSTLLEATSVFTGNTAITSVTISDGVTTASNSMEEMFYGCSSLKTADLAGLDTTGVTSLRRLFSECKKLVSVDVTGWDTSKVEDMSYLFDYCNALTTITGYENWNTGSLWNINKAFNRTTSIHKVDLSKWDLSKITNSGWCFQICYAEEILLPDNLAVMSAGFLNHPAKFAGSTFTIPSGVKKIGYAHTIYDFGTDAFAEFIVPDANSNYQAVDGILYSKDGTELIAIPRGKTFENGIFEVPNTVTFMGELSFSRNYNIETLVLPDEFIIEYVPLYDSRYIIEDGHGGNDTGNLNSGTNLSIAIYCYTGITAYDVRDTNTHYEAVDGVIYSEDMTTMVAVPARYAQHLNIPEGVTTWNKEALWADLAGNSNLLSLLENCTGVSIPSTLTTIDAEQLSMINSLADRTSSTFTITVAEGNCTFHVDPTTGHLATHSYNHEVTDPTCKEQGYTTHTCATCGDSYADSYTEATGHSWADADCTIPKTCSVCGETEGEALGHAYENGICSRCDSVHSNLTGYSGKTISILGDSISTFRGVSNDPNASTAIQNNATFYNGSVLGVALADTWWQQTVDALDLELLVNNSWSGSCIYTTRAGTPGAYVDRCVQLHNNAGTVPDVIAIYLGTNDYYNFKSTLGSAGAINYAQLIKETADGYAYAEPTTAMEAYAIMLHKMTKRYPLAEIYCFTLLPMRNLSAANQLLLEQFNGGIKELADHFDVNVVDLYTDSGIKTDDHFQDYIADNSVHPGPLGMDAITDVFVDALLDQGAPASHTHSYEGVVTPPTCTGEGYTTYTCAACGSSYVGERVPATGHEWQNANCTTPKTCSACGATEGTATGHAWIDATCYSLKTCNNCGITQGSMLEHEWQAADCTNPKHCKNCTATEGKALSHDWQDADCENAKTCKRCGATEGTSAGHSWIEATCYNPRTCSVCGATEGEPLGHNWVAADCDTPKTCSVCSATDGDPLGHTEVIDKAVEATCTETGKTEGSHCSVCNTVIKEQETIPVTGHTKVTDKAVDATCTATGLTEGSHCSVCGKVFAAQQEVPVKEHTEVIDKAVAATCTNVGKTEGSHCSVCGKVLQEQDKIPAMGHTPVVDAAVDPTCSREGLTAGAHCVVCDEVLKAQQPVDKKPHTVVEDPRVDATCTESGLTKGSHCAVCNSVIVKQELIIPGHTYEHQYDHKCDACGEERTVNMTRDMMDMYRMYDPNSGEHFYTGSVEERDHLVSEGWNYEGVGFTFPLYTGKPVHRLYDPATGEHLYTMDEAEKEKLIAEGWNYEGVAFNSGFENEVPQYRLHNPNETRGAYHFTASIEERDFLISLGWEYQGIGWYSMGAKTN